MSMDLGDNIIDSRDVIARINKLRDQFENTPFSAKRRTADKLRRILDDTIPEWLDYYDRDEIEELINLIALEEEAEQYTTEWLSGVTLIHDEYFEKYAKQQAENMGTLDSASWPFNNIDWKAAAEELQQEYTKLDPIDGNEYWVRNT